ncbi:hypothetical protein [Providencia hangzhouensis]|uniref:hypothetical protein n=1 Tax=Providencia hangzhouensis TaxID=3031799 RepID=UPI0034DD72A5
MISNPIKKVAFNINEKHSNNNALRRLIHCLFAENLIDKKASLLGYRPLWVYFINRKPLIIFFKNMEIYPVDTILLIMVVFI